MKKINVTLALVLFINLIFAQKENNMWYFGDHASLDFNSGVPLNTNNNAMYTVEGCTSISDSNGNLLFYSNGEKVWDKNHTVMPNGDTLGGHQNATQAALIAPYPNHSGIYYLFTLQQQYSPPATNFNFSYSIIDMALNSGNGAVTVKNVVIKSPIAEKLCAVKHANGTDIWIMVHGYGSTNDSLFAYLLTNTGLSSTPVASKIGQAVYSLNSLGYMKFSADGSKLAFACRTGNFVDLFDFDNSTGMVSNEKYLQLPFVPLPYDQSFGAYGLEFSASGNYLYAVELRHGSVFQWDVSSNSASTINSTLQAVGGNVVNAYMGALQLAPNGKIYLTQPGTKKLGVINSPESPGVLCNYVDSGFISNYYLLYGLPNFIAFCPPVSGQVIASGATTVCKPLSVTLSCNATAGTYFQWQKNGTNIPGATASTYNATATGNYRVMLLNSCGSAFNTNDIAVTVTAQPVSTITSAGPVTYCKGATPLTLTANSGAFTYKWKKGSAYISGANAIDYNPTATGTYKVEVTNANGCTKLSAGVAVTVNALPVATITPQGTTTFCAGDSVVLAANSGAGLTYQWKKGAKNINGAAAQNYSAKKAGTYKVVVTNSNGCTKVSAGTIITINCREAGEEDDISEVILFPNPASNNLTITLSELSAKVNVAISDITGKIVYNNQDASTQKLEVNTKDFSDGVYFVRIQTDDLIQTKKLIIAR